MPIVNVKVRESWRIDNTAISRNFKESWKRNIAFYITKPSRIFVKFQFLTYEFKRFESILEKTPTYNL